ncbi:hypothetical protein L1987_05295 [Smallanthus sonchifolius]|uniref:Uncharacterized protein n=1 Tax=Smallanthus sonchifolius TaxID=185202 RepID=A0ACB9JV48_9ASTR|nr:hypothetical protein L1987_05295 [Smallanthus sonchifolius]
MIRPEMRKLGFSRRTGRAHLLSAHGAGPAHLLSAQEEGPAHLLSAQEAGSAHLLSAQAAGVLKVKEMFYEKKTKRGKGFKEVITNLICRMKSGNVIPSLVVDYGQRAIVTTRTTWAMSLWHVNGFDVVQLVKGVTTVTRVMTIILSERGNGKSMTAIRNG